MGALLDSGFRALAYCLLPRVILLSALPLFLLVAGGGLLGWLYWEPGVALVRDTLEASATLGWALQWLESIGAPGLRAVLAPLILVALAVPVMVVACLLLVTQFMTPSMVSLVEQRRFAGMERRRGASAVMGLLRSVGLSLLALGVMVLSLPLWLVPPMVLIIPPLVWGWLAMQIMSFDVLAEHATAAERVALMREHRWPLLTIGIISGLLGAAPAWVWALGVLTLVLAPLVMMLSMWIYTAVFAFTALWFAHYLLAALQARRQETAVEVLDPLEPADARGLTGPF